MATVLIFGGASGIGAATGRTFAAHNWNVLSADIKPHTIGRGNIHCDVRDPASVADALHHAGNLDAMVYCAGMQAAMSGDNNDHAVVEELFRVNTYGAVAAVREYAATHTQGVATLVASVAGLTSGGPGLSAYGAAKAAVIGFTKSMALELAPRFRVNCVCPGWTDTPFNAPVTDFIGGRELLERTIVETVPLGRQATPNEIANAIYFISTDAASYITGHTLVVDGGLTV